jgi:antitoxin HicB
LSRRAKEDRLQSYVYPAQVSEIAPGDFEVRFRDVPEAITGGATLESALAEAPDALAAAIEGYLELDRPPPAPAAAQAGDHPVPLEPALAARVALVRAMAEQSLSGRALGARLGWDEKAVRRVLTGRAASAGKMFSALRAVGLQPSLVVVDTPAR